MSAVIRPRVEKFASYFETARVANATDPLRCTCHFGYSLGCPANIRLEIGLSHDEPIETLAISFEMYIVPVFIKYDRHDHLAVRLEAVNDSAVATWVESMLLGFIRTYRRLERASRDQSEILVTDPVCGMRMNRSEVQDQADYKGHAYFFCSPRCKEQFTAEPTHYVTVVIP